MVHGCMVYTERGETAPVSRGTSYITNNQTAMYTTLADIQKRAIKTYSHSCRITREHSESAGERPENGAVSLLERAENGAVSLLERPENGAV